MVSRSNPLPLYEQVKQVLHEQILDGQFAPGSMLPPEWELCERFNVSRITIKRALDELAKESVLERQQGKGTIVRAKPLTDHQLEVQGFSRMLRNAGLVPSTRILSTSRCQADDQLRSVFHLPETSTEGFIKFRRLLGTTAKPMALVNAMIPESIARQMIEIGVENASFYDLITRCTGHTVARSQAVISPIIANAEIAGTLGVTVGSAHIHSRLISYLDTGQPVELSNGVYSADAIQWTAERYELRKEEPGIGSSQDLAHGEFLSVGPR